MLDPVRPPWLAEIQRPPALIPETAARPAPLLFDAEHQPIRSIEAWEKRRKELLERWKAFLGSIAAPRARPTLTVLEEDKTEGIIRQLVRYEAEPGLPVEGYLLRPETTGRGRPGAVVLHSTVAYTIRQPAGLEGTADKHIGLHLARRGYVTFSPRCYLWQYSRDNKLVQAVDWLQKRHPKVTGMGKMLFDAIRAVDILAGQADVDPRRIGTIGHSLGAKEALYLAAFDPRVRATVSSEGGVGLSQSNWEAPWYLGEAIRRPGFPLDNAQDLALIAPRAFLLIGGNSADGDASWPYIDAVTPVWSLTGAADAIGLFNHGQGHAFPALAQERSYQWLDWFLRPETT